MITEEEIQHIAELMKIEIDDHKEYADKVHDMIDYFSILDSAGVESEEITMQSIHITKLRKDCHIPFDGDIMKSLKKYKNNYIRAPRMS
ncbi:MAG: hypothetical protein OXC46_05285 [Thaumarchaeota archaeon]|nr:hypothetical protein [Nitrososphaerota archaeon]